MDNLDTSIDRLVEFIKLKKSTSVEEAARALSLPTKQVEEIAETLAESGLIHLKYEFSGIRLSPQLVPKEAGPAGAAAPRTAHAVERLVEIKAELESVEGMADFSQNDIERRLEAILSHFKETEHLDLATENLDELARRIEELLQKIKSLEGKGEKLLKKAEAVSAEMKRFEKQVGESRRLQRRSPGLAGFLHRLMGKP